MWPAPAVFVMAADPVLTQGAKDAKSAMPKIHNSLVISRAVAGEGLEPPTPGL